VSLSYGGFQIEKADPFFVIVKFFCKKVHNAINGLVLVDIDKTMPTFALNFSETDRSSCTTFANDFEGINELIRNHFPSASHQYERIPCV
jgi:hypothetical protein